MKKEIPNLTFAEALPNYKMKLLFDDGVEGVIDMSDWKGKGVFSYWNDENNFKKFIITDMKKLEWNEDLDIDPDSSYLRLVNKTFEEFINS